MYVCVCVVFFFLDRVFHSNETTKNVYEEIAVPIIDSAIQGYNGLYSCRNILVLVLYSSIDSFIPY